MNQYQTPLPTTRPPIERFHQIVAMLRVGYPKPIQHIADELEVDRKTIERDVEFMVDRLLLPIDQTRCGLILTRKLKICPICVKQLSDE